MPISNNKVFGVFSLGELRNEILSGNNIDREVERYFAWFAGGSGTASPNERSTVSRVSFGNGSAETVGSLGATVNDSAATGNINYGWFTGGRSGFTAFSYASVHRIDFSNDLPNTSFRGPLSVARARHAATGNYNYGWFAGGRDEFPGTVWSSIDRIDFSNDSATASPRAPLPRTSSQFAATGNSNYGWFAGGAGPISSVDRMDFSNDSISAVPRGPLTAAHSNLTAAGNTKYGFFMGSQPVNRIDFSNDHVTALATAGAMTPGFNHAAAGNSTGAIVQYTYAPGPSTIFSGAFYLNYATSGFSYFASGLTASSWTGKQSAMTASGKINIKKAGNSNYGWFGGGINQTPFPVVWVSRVDRIDFSNDSVTASARGPLSSIIAELAATGNSNYGWFGCGTTPTPVSRVDRIDFSNDLSTTSSRGSLTLARSNLTATGNSNYGWFGGGFAPSVPGAVSRVDRINFSNDSITASPRGPLTGAANFISATGNSDFGWVGDATSRACRIDFSNDSAIALLRGPLTSGRYARAATGNSNYGWFGGGAFPYTAAVERIDFSNDSVASSPRGSLTLARRFVTATGNSNYGWWGSGQAGGPPLSTVDRIDFSNDSAIASLRGPLILGRPYTSATSNTPIG